MCLYFFVGGGSRHAVSPDFLHEMQKRDNQDSSLIFPFLAKDAATKISNQQRFQIVFLKRMQESAIFYNRYLLWCRKRPPMPRSTPCSLTCRSLIAKRKARKSKSRTPIDEFKKLDVNQLPIIQLNN